MIRMSSARVGTQLWIANGMRHLQEMTKITYDIDIY